MGERGGDLRGEFTLAPPTRAKCPRGRNVHREDHAEFALLTVTLHERPAHAVGHVPVNVPDVVTGVVLAQILEIHPTPLEMTEVGAHHHIVYEPVGADFHP